MGNNINTVKRIKNTMVALTMLFIAAGAAEQAEAGQHSGATAAITSINLSEWSDRGSVPTWDSIPKSVRNFFYAELKFVSVLYDQGEIIVNPYETIILIKNYWFKYRQHFDTGSVYILKVIREE